MTRQERRERAARRRQRAYDLRCQGLTYKEIGHETGDGDQTARNLVAQWIWRSVPWLPEPQKRVHLKSEMARLRRLAHERSREAHDFWREFRADDSGNIHPR